MDDPNPGATIGIGALGDGGNPMTGDIGGVFIFDSVLSLADRARALKYMRARFGVTVAGI